MGAISLENVMVSADSDRDARRKAKMRGLATPAQDGILPHIIAVPTSRRAHFLWLALRERLPRTGACCLRCRLSGAEAEPACCRGRDSPDPAGWPCAKPLPQARPRLFVLAPCPT